MLQSDSGKCSSSPADVLGFVTVISYIRSQSEASFSGLLNEDSWRRQPVDVLWSYYSNTVLSRQRNTLGLKSLNKTSVFDGIS